MRTRTLGLIVLIALSIVTGGQGLSAQRDNPTTIVCKKLGRLGSLSKACDNKTTPLEEAKRLFYESVGRAMGVALPIQLDPRTAFRQLPAPMGFRPREISCAGENLATPLPPGDYTCRVRLFCMNHGAHLSPRPDMAYEIAPLQGIAAEADATFLNRAVLSGVNEHVSQATSWEIQGSVTPENMPREHQELLHRLIPEYENRLNDTGDFLKPVRDAYNKLRFVPGIPSFEQFLREAGTPGEAYLTLLRKQEFLRANALNYDRLEQQFFDADSPEGFTPGVSPWSEIRPGVLAQLVIEDGYSRLNRLNFRVLPDVYSSANRTTLRFGIVPVAFRAQAQAGVMTIAEILGISEIPGIGPVAAVALIAYAMNGVRSQPQIIVMSGPPRTGGVVAVATRARDKIDACRVNQSLPGDAAVLRGGVATPDSIINGSGVVIDELGHVHGVSVQSAAGTSLLILAKPLLNKQVSVTSVGAVRAAGGNVFPTPGAGFHADLCGITPEVASALLLSGIQPNPSLRR